MNYEQKYKEALSRAKIGLQECNLKDCDANVRRAVITLIHNLFPELKESEDERIRKELIEQIAYIIPNNDEVDNEGNALPSYQERIDKYRAWLEKQGEQPTDKVEPKFKEARNESMD